MKKSKAEVLRERNPSLIFPDSYSREAQSPGEFGNRKLYVITCVSNPLRSRARYCLYKQFAQRVEDAGAILYTVEMAFGDRPHCLTDSKNPRHLQLRSYFELWHKENMLNLIMHRLPSDWEYVAWIDADVQFTRPDWVNETIEQLQHYMFVQMFSHAQDLSSRYEPGLIHEGFMHSWATGSQYFNPSGKNSYGGYGTKEGHPGYAWAARREAIDAVGGLIDWAILGSADRHMACALIGQVDKSFHPNVHKNYKNMCFEWQKRCDKYILGDVGYMDGLILHHFHGKKSNRGYNSRWNILVDYQFDPISDIYPDSSGLLRLHDENTKQRDAIRRYFRSRHEDDTSDGTNKPLS